MDTYTFYHRTLEAWADRVTDVYPDQWKEPTPCREWSVRDLVNHVAGEDRWTVPLVGGATIAEVGDSLDGDLLGEDPVGTALIAAKEAALAVERALPSGGLVHLSYGDVPIDDYVRELACDHLVHTWDLAAAIGAEARADPHLLTEAGVFFQGREDLYRSAGAIGPRATSHGGLQSDLLAAMGRDSEWGPSHAALARFSAAFGAGDVDAIMGLMTEDCVFETTGPAPDGVLHQGAPTVRAQWQQLFDQTRDASFTEEESWACGDRGVLRWRFAWTEDDGKPGHVRGADVLRFRDGKVCEKLSYVKG